MRALGLALLLAVPAAAAHADPVIEARSATAACLSAVINDAPVEDIDGDGAYIRRGKDPVSCTVTVTDGEPVVIREAIVEALKRRSETFSPARTSWAPETFASREAWCNLPGRRAVTAFISTGKPGTRPTAVVTVFETPERDKRCDGDLGVQAIAAASPPSEADKIAELTPPPPKAKKKRWRVTVPGIPGFGGKKDE